MSERFSALAGLPDRSNDAAGVIISELCPAALFQVTFWPDNLSEALPLLEQKTGIKPEPVGRFAERDGTMLISLSPGRFIVLAAREDLLEPVREALAGNAITDLGHARTVLHASGPSLVQVLAKGLAVDLHEAAWPAGHHVQTMLDHMDVLILRKQDGFAISVFRGFAVSLAEWLIDASEEFGIAFRHG